MFTREMLDKAYNAGGRGSIFESKGQFDGQGSGHVFWGTYYTPPTGWRNNTDGGRSVLFPDYRQA
eukprot:JP447416.1.p3 GENE.JP447416.1~~JP447416.1.p3  ORF type:complete len:65 (+),score=27.59 JP447416.1:260-454(+)